MVLALGLCICFFGCNTENTGAEQLSASAEDNIISAITSVSEEESLSDGTTIKAENSSSTSADKNDTSSGSKNAAASVTKKMSTSKSAKSNSTNKQSTKHSSKTTSTTSSTVSCTVTVECKKILNYMDNLKPGHEAFVPSGGVFFSNYPVTVKNGSSVYDAVKIACADNSVTINATSSQYGTYIAGFNNIDEKDCGNQSGWLYSVNGKMPSKSCGKYIVSNGDSIVFSYTCSYK